MTENAKKIFEMLGVEPNEKFKIEGFKSTKYYIDDNLAMFDEDGNVYGNLFRTILLNNDMIIKLPKTKKLRDLTEEELKKWDEKNCNGNCDKCIFRNVICTCACKYESLWVECKYLYSDAFLDQEIEVE